MLEGRSPLIKPQDLVEQLSAQNLVILDCRFSLAEPQRGLQAYQKSHIPGAFYLSLDQDLSQLKKRHGGRHPLLTLEQFQNLYDALGISEATHVIIYDDQRFAFAARCWWMFRAYGHSQVSVLDGGFGNYQALGHPCSNELTLMPHRSKGTELREPSQAIVNRDALISQTFSGMLIDSRHPDRYAGKAEPIDPIAGHIPGAVNYFWQDVVDEQGWMRSPQALREHFAAIASSPDIVVYCGSGVTACVNLLALEVAGIYNAKLYPGSWSDWCSYPLSADWVPLSP